ncbi:MAG: hypothetical protein MZU91_14450 [Desulfosudis oleivorans]|nr:hypothetical protein [Desulfosudis oleivorans]
MILLLGLQGSGKTTTAAKLARCSCASRAAGRSLVAADLRPPGGRRAARRARASRPGVRGVTGEARQDPGARWSEQRLALRAGRSLRHGHRRHLRAACRWTSELMAELVRIRDAREPDEVAARGGRHDGPERGGHRQGVRRATWASPGSS